MIEITEGTVSTFFMSHHVFNFSLTTRDDLFLKSLYLEFDLGKNCVARSWFYIEAWMPFLRVLSRKF